MLFLLELAIFIHILKLHSVRVFKLFLLLCDLAGVSLHSPLPSGVVAPIPALLFEEVRREDLWII